MARKSKRRVSRERLLGLLYAWDAGGMELSLESLDSIRNSFSLEGREDPEFSRGLFDKYFSQKEHIDDIIENVSQNWKLSRMDRVDLALIRIGITELMTGEVPVAVIINESVELGKGYGSGKTARFVNGILHKVAQNISA
ncbi:MAG: transcription antitermination factor NusB [Deltaproteobacteria bacterium]|nr:transcription antitermination factor NusB [Deltaproteobacteria bacterium]